MIKYLTTLNTIVERASTIESQIAENDFWDESKAEINLQDVKSVQKEREAIFTQNIRNSVDDGVLFLLVFTNTLEDFGGFLR